MNLDPVPPVALVVDDEPVARLMVKRALEKLGCAPVLEAADGISAQEVLRKHPHVALVLTDIMMPRMGGLEACLALRADQRFAALPVFMLTAKAQEADVQRGLAAGANDYIVKPFSPREVVARVASTLARTGH